MRGFEKFENREKLFYCFKFLEGANPFKQNSLMNDRVDHRMDIQVAKAN